MTELDKAVAEIDRRIEHNNLVISANKIKKLEFERKKKLKPKGLNGKGETRRNENLPIRIEKDFKKLLLAISENRKQKGLRFSTMTDVITVAVKEYALSNYPELYNEIYKQTSI